MAINLKNITLHNYLRLFLIITILILFLGLSIQFLLTYNNTKKAYENNYYSKGLHNRENLRLLFDKVQYSFRQAESENIKKLEYYFNYFKNKKEFNPQELAKILNKDVDFGHYEVFLINKNYIIAEANHGINFPAIINHNHIWGTQFHPEKSSKAGLEIIKNFITN